MRIVDLTHEFNENMPVYPGDSHPHLSRIAEIHKEGFTDHELKTAMHVGTHMDAPLHMIDGGKYLSEIPVEKFLGKGHLIDARGCDSISEELLQGLDVEKGVILVIFTGHSAHYREDSYYAKFPMLTEAFAQRAVAMGISMICLDTPSPDAPPFPVHKILLGHEVLIVENLTNLESLLNVKNFKIIALPFKLHSDAAATRVIALTE